METHMEDANGKRLSEMIDLVRSVAKNVFFSRRNQPLNERMSFNDFFQEVCLDILQHDTMVRFREDAGRNDGFSLEQKWKAYISASCRHVANRYYRGVHKGICDMTDMILGKRTLNESDIANEPDYAGWKNVSDYIDRHADRSSLMDEENRMESLERIMSIARERNVLYDSWIARTHGGDRVLSSSYIVMETLLGKKADEIASGIIGRKTGRKMSTKYISVLVSSIRRDMEAYVKARSVREHRGLREDFR